MINKTYVVNLKRREDKRNHMINEFNKLKDHGINLNHTFFDAIDGSDDHILSKFNFKIPNWYDPNSGKAMTRGEIGCALSHYLIWEDIIYSVNSKLLDEKSTFLILEDDVIFPNDAMNNFNKYMEEVIYPYDMMYIHRKALHLESEKKMSLHINKANKSYWTCGYMLTYNGAQKLINSNYLENLIPVDEFLPIMYGCSVLGFEKLFQNAPKMNCYAFTPNILKLTGNSFYDSETFHSKPYVNSQSVDDDKKLTVLYIGPTKDHSYQRFVDYCDIYALPYCSVTDSSKSNVELLKNRLDQWSESELKSMLLMVIICFGTDCNTLPIVSPFEIYSKYNALAKTDQIVVSSNFANTDKVEKILLCSMANNIRDMLLQFETRILTNKAINLGTIISASNILNNNIVVDESSDIFQILNSETKIEFNHKKSRIKNQDTGKNPCIIVANDDMNKLMLNRIENYTGNNWNEYYGYRCCNVADKTNSKIYLSLHLGKNNKVSSILDIIDYPKDLLTVRINSIGPNEKAEICYSNEIDMFREDMANFLKTDCDYYFFIGHCFVLTNPNVLKELLQMNKDVIVPLVRKENEVWSNFWGDITSSGYYKRSFDYFDLVKYEKTGCWNVPYVMGVYLIKREIIKDNPDIVSKNDDMDIDMRICRNLRDKNIFMYMCNVSKYGYMEAEPAPLKEVTIFDILEDKVAWEKKYLHPEYYENKNSLASLKHVELCPDIYNFPLFSKEFCKELIEVMEKYGKWSKGGSEHNDPRLGQNYYENVPTSDVQLFEVKLEKQWDNIVTSYVAPVVKNLYSYYKTKGVNLAFVVKYSMEGQKALVDHHDSSTYTINVALNQSGVDFTGGGCHFIRQNYSATNQEVGTALIHPGRLTAYHRGLQITSGTRYILVSFIN